MMEENPWQHLPEQKYRTLRGLRRCSVAIVGAGLTGVTLAWMLCRQGIDTALIEAHTPGSGASFACSGKVTSCPWEAYARTAQVRGMEAAHAMADLYRECVRGVAALASQQEASTALTVNSFHVAALEDQEMPALQRTGQLAQSLGIPLYATTDVGDCPLPLSGALRLERQLLISPLLYLHGLLQDAAAHGCSIYAHSPARKIEANHVLCDRGEVEAHIIVLCTGIPLGCRRFPLLTRMEQRTMMSALLSTDTDFFGSYVECRPGGLALRPLPSGVLVTRELGRTGSACLCRQADQLREELRHYFPEARLEHLWYRQEVHSLDGMPLIGPMLPGDSHLLMATGYNGWGLTGSYLAARLLCRNILGQPLPEETLFLPGRRYPGQWKAFLPGALHQAGAWGSSLMRLGTPRCTHMGCRMRYLPEAERWECPAHGASYDFMGEVRAAPAASPVQITPRHRRRT